MGIEGLDDLKPENGEEPNLEEFAEKANAPHPVDEDPEDHCGDEMPDPWSDDSQTDWPNNVTVPVEAPKEVS